MFLIFKIRTTQPDSCAAVAASGAAEMVLEKKKTECYYEM